MTTRASIYPGILNNSIEIFNHGDDISFMSSGIKKDISELPYPVIENLKRAIEEDKEAESELLKLHPDSEWDRIKAFCRCRFGGLDFFPDIAEGNINAGDYWDCPIRNKCSSEGRLCKFPHYNGHQLNSQEIRLIKLLTSSATNESISTTLEIPLGTFHLLKKNLYSKLGNIQTKQELTIIALSLNLIRVNI